jgi:hypothetical protein
MRDIVVRRNSAVDKLDIVDVIRRIRVIPISKEKIA